MGPAWKTKSEVLHKIYDKSVYTQSGCRIWQGHRMPYGYGVINWQGKQVLVHRLIYEWVYGESPLVVRHKCNVPSCWNPDHLIGGTQKDNMHDSIRIGTHVSCFGPLILSSKLTEDDVRYIRQRHKSAKEFAAQFSVSAVQIYRIWNRQRWQHVEEA